MFLTWFLDFSWSVSYIYSNVVFDFMLYLGLKAKKNMFFWRPKIWEKNKKMEKWEKWKMEGWKRLFCDKRRD